MKRPYVMFSWMGFRPSRWLLVSCIVYLIHLMFGPYNYDMRGGGAGWLFAFFTFYLLWLGLYLGEHIGGRPKRFSPGPVVLSRNGETVLCGIMIVLVIAGIVTIRASLALTGFGFGAEMAEARHVMDQVGGARGRGFFERAAQGVTVGATAPAIIVFMVQRMRSRLTVYLAIACIMMPVALVLLQGGRNGAAFVFAVFAVLILIRKRRGWHPFHGLPGVRIVIVVSIVIAVYLMIGFFTWRLGVEDASQLDVRSPWIYGGEAALRPTYIYLNDLMGGALSPIYRLSYYYGHSLPFFSALFEASDYSKPFWGNFHLRLYDLTIGGGTAAYFEVIESQAFRGLYPTAIQGLLLDFGIAGTLVAALGLGMLWGAISTRAYKGGEIASCVLPLVLVAVAISPIYYFYWGGGDFVIVVLMGVLGALYFSAAVFRTRVFIFSGIRHMPLGIRRRGNFEDYYRKEFE